MLFRSGECANHRVHGANRLGGNSLLELVVFGKQAGESAAKYTQNNQESTLHVESKNTILNEINTYTNEINFYEKQISLGDLFYLHVGIKRDKKSLEKVLDEVLQIKKDLPKMGVKDKNKKYNTNLIEFIEFKNMLDLSQMILLSAISREESRGAHFRTDFEKEDEKFARHTIVNKDGVVNYED